MTRDDLSFLASSIESLKSSFENSTKQKMQQEQMANEFSLAKRRLAAEEAQNAFNNRKMEAANRIAGIRLAAAEHKMPVYKFLDDVVMKKFPKLGQQVQEDFLVLGIPSPVGEEADEAGGLGLMDRVRGLGKSRLGKGASAVGQVLAPLTPPYWGNKAIDWLLQEPGK